MKTIALKRPSANDADLPPEDKCSSSISYPEKSKDQAGGVSECYERWLLLQEVLAPDFV